MESGYCGMGVGVSAGSERIASIASSSACRVAYTTDAFRREYLVVRRMEVDALHFVIRSLYFSLSR